MNEDDKQMNVSLNVEGVDVEALVQEIREEVAQKRREGVYSDARIGRTERHNLMYMADSEELLRFYLGCLRDGVYVDINDYRIEDRRAGWQGRGLVKMKTVIWKLLKFYTFRMWHQQNQINGMMVTAIESSFKQYEQKIASLEKRIEDLEQGRDA